MKERDCANCKHHTADGCSKWDCEFERRCEMTREEAIQELQNCKGLIQQDGQDYLDERDIPLLDMAIEALKADSVSRKDTVTLNSPISIQAEMVAVVRCKDCRHANECHKSVQYTHNEQSTITIGYTPIEWCSRGERRKP